MFVVDSILTEYPKLKLKNVNRYSKIEIEKMKTGIQKVAKKKKKVLN